jgi:hypothetical protein
VPLNDAAIRAREGKRRVFTSVKTGEPLENGRHWFDDAVVAAKLKNFHGARLASYFCELVANEGSAARRNWGFAGA